MDGWNTFSFPFGAKGLFSGANLLLVSGSVIGPYFWGRGTLGRLTSHLPKVWAIYANPPPKKIAGFMIRGYEAQSLSLNNPLVNLL